MIYSLPIINQYTMNEHPPEDINDGNIFDQDNLPDPNLYQDFLNNMINMNLDPNIDVNLTPVNINFALTPEDVVSYQYSRMLETIYLEKADRQFIRDVLVSKDDESWNALCMGQHPRLGAESSLRILSSDVFVIIRKFYREHILSMINDETIEDILLIIEQCNCSVQTAVDAYLANNRDMVDAILYLQC